MLTMTFGTRTITTENPAFVMGIVNVTDDSFYDKSRGGTERAMRLVEQGADIIDIGGESTRPGFTEIPEDEELRRVLPVIREVRKNCGAVISVDTRKALVMRAAAEEGVDILNDVSALEFSAQSADVAARSGCSVVLMHHTAGAVRDVDEYFSGRIRFCAEHGIGAEKIILDPGIGFGKSTEENMALIAAGNPFCGGTFPLLMALSRKRVIGFMTGRDAEGRLAGTLAAGMLSVQRGAVILRVHDVPETLDTLRVMRYINSYGNV